MRIKKNRQIKKRVFIALRKRRMSFAKGVTLLPHLFSLGNAFFGFLSIIFSARGSGQAAASCILMAVLMDALDGRIARYFDASSSLGVELDSLCDSVSFCLAPSLLMYFCFLDKLGPFGIIGSAVYMLSGIFRLARFNLISDQQNVYFLGLPTTVAACFLAALFLNFKSFVYSIEAAVLIFALMLVLAWLMVSVVPFPAFKGTAPNLRKYFKPLIATTFAIIAIFKFRRVLFFGLIVYFLWGIILVFSSKSKERETLSHK
ncbi:CDP-diacylglycerol--serine O-phosphatidyltransferase [Candidatus Babeliales bacterium]|nr:CDP-diacylglycerol--serine O-phosphatidyltransferase [Candidatus Babeliales bacterium]